MPENNASEPLVEYPPGSAFPGVIGRTYDVSSPAWPQPVRSKQGAPNILFIVQDDTGFGQMGCYGSPINTPNIDSLAENGLTFQNMHTTALCSPTRACILTGRNHHSNAMSCITEGSVGFPGHNGYIPFENGFLSEMLLQQGYNTYAIGKWHLTPADQISAAGPYDRWPLGRGFERYYGFMPGDTHQYYPELTYDNHAVEPEKTPEEGYHLTEDLTDKAISFIADAKQVAPDKPFFMYFAPGAGHAPHHVPKEWADKYKGVFDDGWTAYREQVFARQKEMGIVPADAELSRHDPDVQDWETLSDDEKKLYARMMEVFAGFLEHTDYHYGRLFDFLKSIDQWDNTLVMFISDNGASSEGGPTGSVNENKFFNNVPDSLEENLAKIDEIGGPSTFNHYAWGWTFAGNTPFRRWKRETYRGGVSDPFVVHWPAGIKAKGEIRTQYAHAVDMVPTVLEAIGIEAPREIKGVTQSPIEGISFADCFDNAAAPDKHITQYFEMFGHRAIYHDGWRAVCPWPGTSFTESGLGFGAALDAETLADLDANKWELYHVAEDFAENHNVAAENRDKLIELISLWYVEAGKYNVLPIDSRAQIRLSLPRPQISEVLDKSVYYPGTSMIPVNNCPILLNRTHSLTADVEVPEEGADGVLLAAGDVQGGFTFFVQDGKLKYTYNYVGSEFFRIESETEIAPGAHALRYEFEVTGEPDLANGKGAPGIGQLYIDGELVGQTELTVTIPISYGLAGGFTCGADKGSAVCDDYSAPFDYEGKLHRVTVDVTGDVIADPEAEFRKVMATQ